MWPRRSKNSWRARRLRLGRGHPTPAAGAAESGARVRQARPDLRAALTRYAADGVGATKVEDVIADAGVSWATFFRYFPRKQDVLIELAARHYRHNVKGVAEAGLGDGRLRIKTVVERCSRRCSPRGRRRNFTAPRCSRCSPTRRGLRRWSTRATHSRSSVSSPICSTRAATAASFGAGVDPGAAALTFVAGALFPAVQAAAIGADPGPPMRTALEIVWNGVAG